MVPFKRQVERVAEWHQDAVFKHLPDAIVNNRQIHSANDASVALAEHHSGSTEAFVDLMNLRAQDLALRNTIFHSVHGLPPSYGQDPDLSTAYDLAQLGRALIQFPDAQRWAAMATDAC